MSPTFLVFLCFQLLIYLINGYYLSLNTFGWHNASQFCDSYCNSNLASVHSSDQHRESIDLIQGNPYIYKNVWIGLNDIKETDKWEWSDGTTFDFGFNAVDGYIIRGTYPWRQNEPDWVSPDDCVAIEAPGFDQWTDKEHYSNYHFLCNSCNTKLTKYVAINGDKKNYEETGKICEERFGTSLASIHSDADMDEARKACKGLTSTSGCWIGLNDIAIRHDYKWDDGTEFDYATIFNKYPWYYTQPGTSMNGQYCIQIDPTPEEYTWDDSDCNSTARVLCNAPSEICMEWQWFIANGLSTDWNWHKKPCELSNDVMDEQTAIILGEKQFYNDDNILIIDMMYTINQMGSTDGSAGIVFYFDTNNCFSYYYIGIWAGYHMLFFGKFIDGNWTRIEYEQIDIDIGFQYQFGTYYELKVEVTNSTSWDILFNGKLVLNVIDNQLTHFGNKYSGFIGIRNVNTSLSVKSLFVSGDIEYIEDNSLYLSCNNISTMDPTTYPTNLPTMEPTIKERPTFYIIDDKDGDGDMNVTEPDNNNDNIPSFMSTANIRLIWIIGVPIGGLIICFIGAYCLNTYCCGKGEVDPDDSSDDEEEETEDDTDDDETDDDEEEEEEDGRRGMI